MQFHQNELFLLYDPHSNAGKQVKALASDICSHINEVDVVHEKLSPTYWKEIVTLVGVDPSDLLDHSHRDFKSKVKENNYTMNGWLDILSHYPHLIKAPIVIYHGKGVVCKTPTDIMRLGAGASSGNKVMPHLKKHTP